MGSGDAKIPRRYGAQLTRFFEANSGWVFGHAYVRTNGDRARAEDLVQDTFEAAARDWQTLRKLTEEQQRAWLKTVLSRKDAREYRRSEALRDGLPELYRKYQARAADTPDEAEHKIAARLAAKIIGELPDQQKNIARMRWNDHMKLSEIATALDIAEGTVGAHLYQIRCKLKKGLGPYYPFVTNDEEGRTS